MKTAGILTLCSSLLGRYAAVAFLLMFRAHYFITVIIAPVFWR